MLGAGGGVGLTAVEIGHLLGAEVFAAASSAEKLELAGSRGATHLINYTEASLREQVRELTGGQGVDVIYDPVGGELFDDCLRSVDWGGRILIIGFASGTIPNIPANLPLLKGTSLVGVFWGTFAQREPEANLQNMRELFAWFEQGKLKPCISKTYSLEDAPLAMKALLERRASGKLVVTLFNLALTSQLVTQVTEMSAVDIDRCIQHDLRLWNSYLTHYLRWWNFLGRNCG